MSTLKRLFWSSRPISWVNTAYPFAASFLVVSQTISPLLLVGSVYFLIAYNLMMYGVNDIFDFESDMQNPRKKGIEGIVLQKQFHRAMGRAVCILNIPPIIYLLWYGSLTANVVLVLVVFMVLAYSLPILRFKERPFLDSFTSASHFAGPMVYGLTLAGWEAAFWPYVGAFFAWGMASHAFGAVQDIIPDRKAGIGSVGTVIGARWTVRFAVALYLLSTLLIALQGPDHLAVAAVGLLYAANILPYAKVSDRASASANRAWRRFIWLNYLAGAVVTITLIRLNL